MTVLPAPPPSKPVPSCPHHCGRGTRYVRDPAWGPDMHRCTCGTFFRLIGGKWVKCTHDRTVVMGEQAASTHADPAFSDPDFVKAFLEGEPVAAE